MEDSLTQLQNYIVNEFMTKCKVSKDEAIQNMKVIFVSYAHSSGKSINDSSDKDMNALKLVFTEEFTNSLSANHPNHASFVNIITNNIYSKAKN